MSSITATSDTQETSSTVPNWLARVVAWLVRASTSDVIALSVLAVFTLISVGVRFRYDNWLGEFDVFTMFIPWFGYIGERLASGEIPAWNPHYFNGYPVAANPSSGWLYIPVMVLYPIFNLLTATKMLLLTHAVIGGGATYAFGRKLGFVPVAALMSASIFVLGNVVYGATNYMTIGVMASVFLVVSLLAVEMALTATRDSAVIGWSALAGVGICQMTVAWPGQGILYGMIWIVCWLVFRTFLDIRPFWKRSDKPEIREDRLLQAILVGSISTVTGLALSSAMVLPMLDFLAESTIPNGDYQYALGGDYASNAPSFVRALSMFVHGARNPDFNVLSQAYGVSVLMLAIFGVALARRKHAATFFAVMFVGGFSLMVENSPTLWLFSQLPLVGDLHAHRPTGISWMMALAPSMLAGAAVQRLHQHDYRAFNFNKMYGYGVLLALLLAAYYSEFLWAGWWPILTGAAVVFLVTLPSLPLGWAGSFLTSRQLHAVVAWALVGVIFLYPTFTETWRVVWQPETPVGGISITPGKEEASTWAVETSVLTEDPDTAAEFLQTQLAATSFFRFAPYAGQGYPDPQWIGQPLEGHKSAYSWRRLQPGIIGIMVNLRTQQLDLYQTGGYNPVQLRFMTEYLDIANGRRQDYHWNYPMVDSLGNDQLMDMLNVRYIVVDATISETRSDHALIRKWNKEVYRDDLVIVYENYNWFQHAWVVYDVQDNGPTAEGLIKLADNEANARITAFVNMEGDLPVFTAPADGGRSDTVFVVRYEPEEQIYKTSTTADGFMVISDPWATGWKAYIDGEEVPLIRTNHALRGVVLPAGEHTVEIRYESASLDLGLKVTGGTAIAMIGVWGWALSDVVRRKREDNAARTTQSERS